MVKSRAAIVRSVPGAFEIVQLDVEDPRPGEITVRMVGSGLCLSDEHLISGEMPAGVLPMCGGHEGAGEVVAVGPGTKGFAVGDHVVLSATPACGRCRYCATGHQSLCDLSAQLLSGARFDEPGSYRMHLDGVPVGQWCGISTFSEFSTVSVQSAVRIPKEMPLDRACLIGCGVNSGWGATVNSGQVKPGDTVIVMGCGGVGNFAVQGAAHAGALNIIACDPIESKRRHASAVGATHGSPGIHEAAELARELTDGHGADCCVITLGTMRPEHLQQAVAAVARNGTVVCSSVGKSTDVDFKLSIFDLIMSQKRIQGSMAGAVSPTWDILKMIRLYQGGRLKLDDAITQTYTLDQINEGYRDLKNGKNVRGVILFEQTQ